jgi:DNA-binding MarR family transcriptional regulator
VPGTGTGDRQVALLALEHEIGSLLGRIRRGLGDRAVMLHPDLNPTTYLMVLMLAERGACRAADLAETFALDKGSVSRAVHQLVELGLVERTPDPEDGRASLLGLTDDAVRRLADQREQRRETFDRLLSDWAAEEIGGLASALGRFNDALLDQVGSGRLDP